MVPTKFWQIFKLSPPIIMGGVETMKFQSSSQREMHDPWELLRDIIRSKMYALFLFRIHLLLSLVLLTFTTIII